MNRGIAEIIQMMSQNFERDISMFDKSFLEKSIDKRISALSLKSMQDYFNYLDDSTIEANQLCESLTITYSEFFRSPLSFAILEQWILPKIMEDKAGTSEIRIWSAGCASGQEAYSVAMLLDKLIAFRTNETRFRVIGSDISEEALAASQKGLYDAASMRNVSLSNLEAYFTKHGEIYAISPKIKSQVIFTYYDLLSQANDYPQESIFGDFDLVFCSNLLFYYSPEKRKFIIDKIMRSLAPNGYLITGEAEKHFLQKQKGLKEIAPPSSVFQKK